jgi:hypothetical protein
MEEISSSVNRKEVDSSADFLELARGIEPPICGEGAEVRMLHDWLHWWNVCQLI